MVNVHQVKTLAARPAKAEALVRDGVVFPVAGLDGYAVVRNGHGTQMYLVRHAADHEHCTCPDFQHRQGKHILAAQIAAGSAPQAPDAETVKRLKAKHSLALLNGDEEEVDRIEAELARLGAA
jgi:hypothetical protein